MNIDQVPAGDAAPRDPGGAGRKSRHTALLVFLFVVFVLLRVAGSAPSSLERGRHHVRVNDSAIDNESLQDLMSADLMAKVAFLGDAKHSSIMIADPNAVVKPDKKSLKSALSSAEKLDVETHNSPGAARRVMILRSLLHLDPLAVIRHKYLPLNAFTKDLPAGIVPSESEELAQEGRAWSTVFSGSASPKQYDRAAGVIENSENVRWWKWPALVAVYTESGDLSQANEYAKKAQSDAVFPLLIFGGVGLLSIGLGLLGLVFLIMGIAAGVQRFQGRNVSHFYGVWNVAPEPVKIRRLSSDDLLIVFVIYLIASEALSLLLGGFSGFGPKHALSFGGALTPYLPQFENMSARRRSEIAAGLESAAYIFSALPSFGVLAWLAKRRGTSLREIGWTRLQQGKNVLYGIGGFAISTPILFIVSTIADRVFKHAPDPSNPVIPELASATGVLSVAVLIALAVICAPIVEELLFRGALYNGIKLRLGIWPAILLSGLVFGCIHPVGIAEKLALSSLGMVFAWMAETRKSLVPSMTAHAINNGRSTLLLMLLLKG